jgi:hypothetical protein
VAKIFLPAGTDAKYPFVGVGTYSEATRERTGKYFQGVKSLEDINKIRDAGAIVVVLIANFSATDETPVDFSAMVKELAAFENPAVLSSIYAASRHTTSNKPITKVVISQPSDSVSPEGGTRFNVAIHRAFSYGAEEVATYQALVFPKNDTWVTAEFKPISK